MAMTNYDSARVALARCLDAFPASYDLPLDVFLPANAAATTCTPDHLFVALQLAGLDAALIDTTATGRVVHDAIKQGWLAVVCAGLRPDQEYQRWLVSCWREGDSVGFKGALPEDALFSPEPAYFQPVVIVVRGRQGHVPGQWPERN